MDNNILILIYKQIESAGTCDQQKIKI